MLGGLHNPTPRRWPLVRVRPEPEPYPNPNQAANVFMFSNSYLKLGDFGVSKVRGRVRG